MDIEQAIETMQHWIDYEKKNKDKINKADELIEVQETILKELDNSIPKEKVEKYLKEEQERFEVYKKESKTNENLKPGMFRHLGAKNMCEKILGIEKNIATLD